MTAQCLFASSGQHPDGVAARQCVLNHHHGHLAPNAMPSGCRPPDAKDSRTIPNIDAAEGELTFAELQASPARVDAIFKKDRRRTMDLTLGPAASTRKGKPCYETDAVWVDAAVRRSGGRGVVMIRREARDGDGACLHELTRSHSASSWLTRVSPAERVRNGCKPVICACALPY